MSDSDSINRKSLYHMARGARVLQNKQHEQLAQLLSVPSTAGEYERLLNITPEQVEEIKLDSLFQRRLEYLSKKRNKVKAKRPRTPEEYRDYALKKLYQIINSANSAKDRITACKVLGVLAGELVKVRPALPPAVAEDTDGLSELQKAFGGEE